MFAALQNPVLLLALLIGAWAAWRLLRWAASGGRLPLRGRRGSASGFSGAALAVQALYQPGTRHVIEMKRQQDDQREDEDEGDPPDAGEESGV